MNPYQPSANNDTVLQRIDDRRAAAAHYRLAKAATEEAGPGRLTRWRCAIGNRFVAMGEALRVPKGDRLKPV